MALRNGLCNFGRGHYGKHSYEIILNLDQWLSRRCRLMIFSIFSSGGNFCLAEQNHLSNFGKGHFGENSSEIILNLDQWFRRCISLKTQLRHCN